MQLANHTDQSLYGTPGLLLGFHCAMGEGNNSLTDGAAVAYALKERYPQHYRALTELGERAERAQHHTHERAQHHTRESTTPHAREHNTTRERASREGVEDSLKALGEITNCCGCVAPICGGRRVFEGGIVHRII